MRKPAEVIVQWEKSSWIASFSATFHPDYGARSAFNA